MFSLNASESAILERYPSVKFVSISRRSWPKSRSFFENLRVKLAKTLGVFFQDLAPQRCPKNYSQDQQARDEKSIDAQIEKANNDRSARAKASVHDNEKQEKLFQAETAREAKVFTKIKRKRGKKRMRGRKAAHPAGCLDEEERGAL